MWFLFILLHQIMHNLQLWFTKLLSTCVQSSPTVISFLMIYRTLLFQRQVLLITLATTNIKPSTTIPKKPEKEKINIASNSLKSSQMNISGNYENNSKGCAEKSLARASTSHVDCSSLAGLTKRRFWQRRRYKSSRVPNNNRQFLHGTAALLKCRALQFSGCRDRKEPRIPHYF